MTALFGRARVSHNGAEAEHEECGPGGYSASLADIRIAEDSLSFCLMW